MSSWCAKRDLDEREAGLVGRVDVELVQPLHDLPGLAVDLVAVQVAAGVVHREAGDRRRERGDRRGPRVQVRRGRDLEHVLQPRRQREEGQQRAVRLAEPRDQDDVVVGLALMADDAVAAQAPLAELVGGALADHAEPVGVVDVQERVVLAGDARELLDVGGVPGHRVHAVDRDHAGRRRRRLARAARGARRRCGGSAGSSRRARGRRSRRRRSSCAPCRRGTSRRCRPGPG